MKNVLFLVILCCCNLTHAQDWSIINNERTVFFQHSDSSFISNTIVADSIKVIGNNTSYFTGYGFKYCDTCANFSEHQPIIYRYSKECLGFNIVDDVDNNQQTLDNKIVKHNAEINDTWIFDLGINAEVVSKTEIQILDVNDSVKTIELNGLDTIIISKNFGVIRYPDFENGGNYYQMVGYHEGQNSYGEYLPNFWRTYDFSVGDVFCFQNDYSDGGLHQEWGNKRRLEIIEDLSSGDTIKYKIKDLSIDYSQSIIGIGFDDENEGTNYTARNRTVIVEIYDNHNLAENQFGVHKMSEYYNWNNQDSLNFYTNIQNNVYALRPMFPNNTFLTVTGFVGILGTSKKNEQFLILDDSLLIKNTDVNLSTTFRNGFGRTFQFIEDFEFGGGEQLIGSIINGDTTGTIYNYPDDLGFEERSHQFLNFYPNPASETININQPLKNLKMYNNLGQMVLNINEPNQIINISQLPKGLYFIVGTDLNSEFLKSKLIID